MAIRRRPIRVVVLGDLLLDVVLAPTMALRTGTDVPGRVLLRQGGSAATTARWLGRLGVRTTLITAVGRDAVGRTLVQGLLRDGVIVRRSRVTGTRTGRIGVILDPDGERSFVADRGAADRLRPEDLDPAWFRQLDGLHLPAYSLLGDPLGRTGRQAIELARAGGAVVSLDLASSGPLLAGGREAAIALVQDARPDILFATAGEADDLLGPERGLDALLGLAPVAMVKQGAGGVAVLAMGGGGAQRFEVATARVHTTDTTGAGDAFDAGVLAAWLAASPGDRHRPAVLRRAALAGQRTARRQLTGSRPELTLG